MEKFTLKTERELKYLYNLHCFDGSILMHCTSKEAAIKMADYFRELGFVVYVKKEDIPTDGFCCFGQAVAIVPETANPYELTDEQVEEVYRFCERQYRRMDAAGHLLKCISDDVEDVGELTLDVAAGIAEKCEVQLAYAIGVANPVSINVNTFGTGKITDEIISQVVKQEFDLRPDAIIDKFNLRRPIYQNTAAYGHFGRAEFP